MYIYVKRTRKHLYPLNLRRFIQWQYNTVGWNRAHRQTSDDKHHIRWQTSYNKNALHENLCQTLVTVFMLLAPLGKRRTYSNQAWKDRYWIKINVFFFYAIRQSDNDVHRFLKNLKNDLAAEWCCQSHRTFLITRS